MACNSQTVILLVVVAVLVEINYGVSIDSSYYGISVEDSK